MFTSTHLLKQRRFLPLFVTQLLNAFNDNLYKTAMVLFVVYAVYNSADTETIFSGVASAVFILPFFLLSAIAGQLADLRDKAAIIRIVKAAEIVIMAVGAMGLFMAWRGFAVDVVAIPLLMLALFAMGTHSTFFGPIKYAILPQHLEKDEVLAGTGLVEAGTYLAIMAGTILAGFLAVEFAAIAVVGFAIIGYFTSRQVPPAPPMGMPEKVDFNPFTSSYRLVRDIMHNREVFYAILAISFFWTIGAVLFIQFPPLAKNVLMANKEVASLFLVFFSIGVAIGSVAVNLLLKGTVSARYAPFSVLAMGAMVAVFYFVCRAWNAGLVDSRLMDVPTFLSYPLAWAVLSSLLFIAIFGGMFVVPLYAFLTTKVPTSQASRAVAANNIVNSGAMVVGSLLALALSAIGIPLAEQLLLSAAMCLVSAWLGGVLYKAEKAAALAGSAPAAAE
ncbi:1-acyl-sn-glycerol-3-phosphate acyltransferase [Aurantiacibacter atlanticus]|uniref:1-acyl-sn-glycerol-3-phosphate acyltransferase n=1 Tax=Aurantiacibacter atlanticus TaxID=1648404 RepID=A0A0H4VKB2_9SPHN|nr:MFS transporter [Aurantiacibacter atlanticus]AKQ43316.1 1-acyl-sn-glycerol-3-phosphate acyltransferase [Aurantiacibacter atlanticus]MDF1835655.1 MFS transporter [Alteraurantiacibacter sp. bin_em_oilr2.035]